MRILRTLLGLEAVSLAIAAAVHSGVMTNAPFEPAAMYEGGLAAVLFATLILTILAREAAWVAGLGSQLLTLAGASVGLYLAIRGVAPHSFPDLVFHVVLGGALIAGLVVAWRIRATSARSGEAE